MTKASEQAVRKTQQAEHDTITVRVLTGAGDAGSLSLDHAAQLVRGLRDLVAFSASVEIKKDAGPYLTRVLKRGVEWAGKFRFAHTSPGSFCFTIETPPMTSLAAQADGADVRVPIARRVVERIARGSEATRKATQSGDPGALTDNYQIGFNANMCRVLADMTRDGTGIDLDFSWAPAKKPSQDVAKLGAIRLNDSSSQYLSDAALALEGAKPRKTRIVGRIVSLRSRRLPHDPADVRGRAYIRGQEDGNGLGTIGVHAVLNYRQYNAACDAHRDGHRIVMDGELYRSGKSWEMNLARSKRRAGSAGLHVLPGDPTTDAPPPSGQSLAHHGRQSGDITTLAAGPEPGNKDEEKGKS